VDWIKYIWFDICFDLVLFLWMKSMHTAQCIVQDIINNRNSSALSWFLSIFNFFGVISTGRYRIQFTKGRRRWRWRQGSYGAIGANYQLERSENWTGAWWGEAGERRDLVMECHQAVGQLSCSSRPPAVVLVMTTDSDRLQPCSVARRRWHHSVSVTCSFHA